jgi:hypothetical protein
MVSSKQEAGCSSLSKADREHAKVEMSKLEKLKQNVSNPHIYKVSLSDKLHQIKKDLLTWHQENSSNHEKGQA